MWIADGDIMNSGNCAANGTDCLFHCQVNDELIECFEKKIQAAIGRVWGEGDSESAMTKVDNG